MKIKKKHCRVIPEKIQEVLNNERSWTVRLGDCIEIMKSMPDNLVDSIVTDPPYGLGFMGKEWDTLPPGQEWAEEALRVLKPGGYLLAFGGTRTYHRLVVALEDAGFEIRDTIMWLYGQGFPKSFDISKAIDKKKGAKRKVVGIHKIPGYGKTAVEHGVQKRTKYEFPKYGSAVIEEAKKWNGWGTALKPACEPIVVARKPLIGSVAENVLEWGTGAINVDGTRISTNERLSISKADPFHSKDGSQRTWNPTSSGIIEREQHNKGRWPANVILDEEAAELLDEHSGNVGDGFGTENRKASKGRYGDFSGATKGKRVGFGDNGGASRFFYCAKASKKERNLGQSENNHPTVKPIALMQYLVRLVTQSEGIVFDPFVGSGMTGIAARHEKMRFIGIDNDPESVKISHLSIED